MNFKANRRTGRAEFPGSSESVVGTRAENWVAAAVHFWCNYWFKGSGVVRWNKFNSTCCIFNSLAIL